MLHIIAPGRCYVYFVSNKHLPGLDPWKITAHLGLYNFFRISHITSIIEMWLFIIYIASREILLSVIIPAGRGLFFSMSVSYNASRDLAIASCYA